MSNAVPGTRYEVTVSSISATAYSSPVSRTVATNVTSKYMFSIFFLSFFFSYKVFGPFINLLDGTIYIGNMCIECMKTVE